MYKSLRCFKSTDLSVMEKKLKKNRCSRGPPSWISDRNNFSYFYLQDTRCFLLIFELVDISAQVKKRKIDFKDGGHGGFPIGTSKPFLS